MRNKTNKNLRGGTCPKTKSDGPRVFPVPTGLLALQGQDDLGVFIRKNLKKLGVTTEFIKGESEVQMGQS